MSDPPSKLARAEAAERGGLVLVVDDDELSRDLVIEILSDAGYAVRGAEGAEEAREVLKVASPRAIILDLRMPRVDGIALCRWIRSRPDALAVVPVLFLSACDSLREQLDALRAGGNDFLAKPVDEDMLVAKLRSALAMSDLVQQATSLGERTSKRPRS
jgi:DNA-binding response OmpR family regulator